MTFSCITSIQGSITSQESEAPLMYHRTPYQYTGVHCWAERLCDISGLPVQREFMGLEVNPEPSGLSLLSREGVMYCSSYGLHPKAIGIVKFYVMKCSGFWFKVRYFSIKLNIISPLYLKVFCSYSLVARPPKEGGYPKIRYVWSVSSFLNETLSHKWKM